MKRIRHTEPQTRTRGPAAAAHAVDARTSTLVRWVGLALAGSALVLLLGPPPAHAQFGSPMTYNIRVVDQSGRSLDGSMVRIEGVTSNLVTPASVSLMPGPQLVTIEPAIQGAMLPGGFLHPAGANGLSRNEFLFLDPMGSDLVIEWRTAEVAVSVVDQDGLPIPGASWGLSGDGAAFGPGSIVLPLTDEGLYPSLTGPSIGGWWFDVRATFDGAGIDLVRSEQRESSEGMSALAFEWRQTSCAMGVVDAGGTPIRGATWTILGHTFAAGDGITLPTTDESLYPGLAGTLAAGFPASLSTNTGSGSGDAVFEVTAGGPLSPAFVDVNGGSFGLRCGVNAFPPLTTGLLSVSVTAEGVAFPGAQVTVVDANGATGVHATGPEGAFELTDVPEGVASLSLAVPVGYYAVNPATGAQTSTIVAGSTSSVSFTIAADATPPPTLRNNPETWAYWHREVGAALRGHGRRDESAADMATHFPQAIFADFAQRAADPVRVEGVTQVDPDGDGAQSPRRLTLAEMDTALDPRGSEVKQTARRELLVILLNVVSGRLDLGVTVDGATTTVEEEIQRLAAAINTSSVARLSPGNRKHDEPESLIAGEDEAAAPSLTALRGVGSVGGARLSFWLPSAQQATLDLYDATGRHQARLYEGMAPAGTTTLSVGSVGGRAGIYFARLRTDLGILRTKVIASR